MSWSNLPQKVKDLEEIIEALQKKVLNMEKQLKQINKNK